MDFFNGREFFLCYGAHQQKHWKSVPPTLTQVIHALRGIEELTNVEPGTSEDSYKKKLDKCKIKYHTHDRKRGGTLKNGEKVLNFIQGMLFHEDFNSVYWHIKGLWCNLEPSYILLIQKQLLELIQRHLRDSTTLGLKFSWPLPPVIDDDDGDGINENEEHFTPITVLAIEAYLEQYRQHPNYFVSPSPGSGIVDMIKISKTRATDISINQSMTTDTESKSNLTLFYMISSLSHKVISQGVRVTNSLTGLMKGIADIVSSGSAAGTTRQQGVGGSELNLEELKKLYELVKLKPNFHEVASTFTKFKMLLRDSSVVVGIGKESVSTARTLEEEAAVPISIEPMHIEEQLNLVANDVSLRSTMTQMAEKLGTPDDLAQLSSELHRLMITNEMIGPDNTITSKLVALSPISEPISELKEFSSFLNKHIIKAFQPSGSTFLAKMELIRIRRYFMNLGIRKFFIAEIPLAQE